jgi:hypothetical protein
VHRRASSRAASSAARAIVLPALQLPFPATVRLVLIAFGALCGAVLAPHPTTDLFSATAQIIPVFLIVLAIEKRILGPAPDAITGRPALPAEIVNLFCAFAIGAGELLSLKYLVPHPRSQGAAYFVCGVVGGLLTLVIGVGMDMVAPAALPDQHTYEAHIDAGADQP